MQRPEPLAATSGPNLIAHERTQRLCQAAEWLLDGMQPRDVVTKGCAAWGVGKRMAQLYVACARKQLHCDALQQSHLFAHELAQHQRLKVFHESRAVVNDPQVSDARRRAQISFFGKVTRLFADYEKSAQQADDTHSYDKFRPNPLKPVDLQLELERIEAESNVVDSWVEQAEAAVPVEVARVAPAAVAAPAPPAPTQCAPQSLPACAAEQGTDGNVQVASIETGATAATVSASPQTKREAAQAAPEATPQSKGQVELATNDSHCANCADCALDEDKKELDLANEEELAQYARCHAPVRVQEAAASKAYVPVPEAVEDETTPAQEVEAEKDALAQAMSKQDHQVPEPVKASGSPSGNGQLAQSKPKAQLPDALAIAASCGRHSLSEILARAQCAELQQHRSATGRSRVADYEQGEPPIDRR